MSAQRRTGASIRSSLRTAIIIVAPSAFVIVGVWLGSAAGLVLLKDSFDSGLLIMIGGTAVAVTASLGVILLIDRQGKRM